MFILNIFGVTSDLDAFFASNTINFIIQGIANSSINSALTPILIKHYKNNDISSLSSLSSNLVNLIFIVFFIFGLAQYVFAEPIIKVLVPGFDGQTLDTVIYFFKVQAFLSIFTILSSLFMALHYMEKRFYRTILISIAGSLVQISVVWFLNKQLGIISVLVGLILSQLVMFILYLIPFRKMYRFRLYIDEELRGALKKIYPLTLSSGFSKSNILVDRFFASTLSGGSISLLHYGTKLLNIISNFTNKGITLVSIRKFSLAQDDEKKFQSLFYIVFKATSFIAIPVAMGLIFYLKDILQLLVVTDKLNSHSIKDIYLVTVCLIGVLIGGSLNATITNAFYAKGLTSIISKMNVSLQLFGITLKIVLFLVFGFFGLPIAFSIASLTGTIILYVLYYKYIYEYSIKGILTYFLIILILSGLTTSLSLIITNFVTDNWLLRLMIGPLVAVLGYLILTLFFENDISKMIYSRLRDSSQKLINR